MLVIAMRIVAGSRLVTAVRRLAASASAGVAQVAVGGVVIRPDGV